MKHFIASNVARLVRLLPTAFSYAASSGSLLVANAAQLVTFAILARSFGAVEFGVFVSVTAMTSIAVHLCGLGASECLVRRVARDQSMYPVMMGHNLILTLTSGVLLVFFGMVILPFWIKISADPFLNTATIFLLLTTNIVLVRIILLAEQIFIGHSQFPAANRSVVGFAFARTTAAILACLIFGVSSLAGWAVWQFATHLLVAIVYLWSVRKLGRPQYRIVREEIRLGILFATPFIFRAIRQNVDLLVLGIMANPEVVGSYGVARRISDSSYLSIDAMNRLVYPGLAQASIHGIHHAIHRTKKVLLAALGIGLGSAIFIFVLAPYLPVLFGHEYVSLVSFCRILSGSIIFVALWSVAIDTLGASGNHGPRAAILNIGNAAGAFLIAWATWVAPPAGTFLSIYAIEAGIMVAAWIVLIRLVRRSQTNNGDRLTGK